VDSGRYDFPKPTGLADDSKTATHGGEPRFGADEGPKHPS
jgi:hypothetical protein